MSDAFIGEIRMWAPNFAPLHWTFCNGQVLAIPTYTPLYSLIGSVYGGDGRSSFGLPDMRGRAPMHWGTGPGLTPHAIGQRAGVEDVTLDITQIPSHAHNIMVADSAPTSDTFANKVNAKFTMYQDPPGAPISGIAPAGTIAENTGGESHTNMMPWLSISFIICLENATYPQRN